jgi:hypothetical protein
MNSASAPRRHVLAALLAAAALAAPALLAANMANPVQPGDVVGEPSAALAGVTVEREALSIDLRPLERRAPAVVEATYRLRNDGPARELPLVFVADALAAGSGVWVDGRPVPAALSPAGTLPPAWSPPASTPSLDGGTPLRYEAGRRPGEVEGGAAPVVLSFLLPLDSGRHTVRVRYRARATAYSHRSPAVNWQLGYVLAPARQWAGFGGLDARILLPAGWKARAAPALRREGDALAAAWDSLPANALAVTARAPTPPVGAYQVLLLLAAAAGLGICIAVGLRVGRTLAVRRRSAAWGALLGTGLGLVWATAVVAGAMAFPAWVSDAMGTQAAVGYGYGISIVALLLFPVLFLLVLALVMIAVFRAHRRTTALLARPFI